MARLKDRVAIVTGAGSIGPGWGNGKAAAVTFAREGAKIFAIDINEDAAAETTDIDPQGGRHLRAVPRRRVEGRRREGAGARPA